MTLRLRRFANPWLILAAIFVAHAVANAVWISRDHSLRSYDMGPHLEFQANAYAVVMDEGLKGVARVARGDGPQIWPSAGYLPWVSLALVFGQSVRHMQMYNLFYLALLMAALFLTGRKIHSSRAGVLAAALASFYPLVYGDGRQFGIDMPGAACATLAIYLMLCTRRLSRPWHTLGLGAVCGAGLLICPRIALFLVPAAACLLVVSLRAPQGTTRTRVLLHAALGLTAAGAVSACWWWGRLASMLATLAQHQQGLGRVIPEPSALYYLKVLPWALSFYLVLMAALALGVLVRRRGTGGDGLLDPDRLLLVLVWLGAGLLALLIFKVHHLRHLLPLLPAVALLTAVGLCAISPRGIRRLVIGLALGVAVISWLLDSFATQVNFGLDLTHTGTLIAEREVTTGPPTLHTSVLAVEEAAQVLHDRHGGSGFGVVLQLHLRGVNDDPWASRPLLTCALPGLWILQRTYDDTLREANTPYLQIWGCSIARSVKPARHCYNLVLNTCPPKGCTRPPPPEHEPGVALKLVLDRTIEDVRITLWRRSRCPQALTTSANRERRSVPTSGEEPILQPMSLAHQVP